MYGLSFADTTDAAGLFDKVANRESLQKVKKSKSKKKGGVQG